MDDALLNLYPDPLLLPTALKPPWMGTPDMAILLFNYIRVKPIGPYGPTREASLPERMAAKR